VLIQGRGVRCNPTARRRALGVAQQCAEVAARRARRCGESRPGEGAVEGASGLDEPVSRSVREGRRVTLPGGDGKTARGNRRGYASGGRCCRRPVKGRLPWRSLLQDACGGYFFGRSSVTSSPGSADSPGSCGVSAWLSPAACAGCRPPLRKRDFAKMVLPIGRGSVRTNSNA
jgi:hypothetical protein